MGGVGIWGLGLGISVLGHFRVRDFGLTLGAYDLRGGLRLAGLVFRQSLLEGMRNKLMNAHREFMGFPVNFSTGTLSFCWISVQTHRVYNYVSM